MKLIKLQVEGLENEKGLLVFDVMNILCSNKFKFLMYLFKCQVVYLYRP